MEWISVKDRLPETDSRYGQYIVTVSTNGLRYVCTQAYNPDLKEFGEWVFAPNPDNDRWKKADVTHWMPLPNLPKEEGRIIYD